MTRTVLALLASCCLIAPASPLLADDPAWAAWVQPDFPFYSSSLDLRPQSPNAIPWNITPRGIILNLGNGCWACFDTELLRVSAIWAGKGVTAEGLAPLTYKTKDVKTTGGQSSLPKPDGQVWLTNGVYPGWQTSEKISLQDQREPQPSKEEPGRGPLPADEGRFKAIHVAGRDAVLEYTVAGAKVEEWITASEREGKQVVQRNIRVAPCARALSLILGLNPAGGAQGNVSFSLSRDPAAGVSAMDDKTVWAVSVPAHEKPLEFSVAISNTDTTPPPEPFKIPAITKPGVSHWPEEVVTNADISKSKDPYVIDDIPLPLGNPWHRNVRLTSIAFFKDGTAAGVTFDGDVWIIRGLREDLGQVRWKRFATGLDEPMGIAIRDEQIYVFDRNGIWRLQDTTGDGEADDYALFSNVFPQSAETREFPNSMQAGPDGSFVIAKGGQQASTISKLNGSVLRVSPDGQSFTVLGYGFRQPFAGVNPSTGVVTVSDQEGNYTPTTPLYLLQKNEYHGFLSELLPKEQYPAPIAEPLTWIPHPVNPSAATQTWLIGSKMGPLDGSLIHLAFMRPELFRVMLNNRFPKPQAAVVSVVRDFDLPLLNAAVNPADGFLYMTGFQVLGWGTTAKRVSGLMRVRYTGAPCVLPREVVPMDKGVLIRFDVALDPNKALDLASYTMESWHYKRTYKYGSPHLKADGTPGQDWLTPSSVYLSEDDKAIFIGVPDMKPVMQMRVGWALTAADGSKVQENAYFTPAELAKFDPRSEGFGNITVDLTPKAAVAQTSAPASAEEGQRLYQLMGCMACHATDETVQPKIGPSWKGLYGKMRKFTKGPDVVADDAYIRESILAPAAKTVKGYDKVEAAMPIYEGVLTESQIQSLILFIKTLK
jgi:cytochrome c2